MADNTKLNGNKVQNKNVSQESDNEFLSYKITQETMDKLYAYIPYDEMVKIVGVKPIITEENEKDKVISCKYNISGEEFEKNNCTLDLTFRNNVLDDANTGYMNFKYSDDTKFVKAEDYCNLKIGDSLASIRKTMDNSMRFNKIFWDELNINPKEYQAIIENNIRVILHFSNNMLDSKKIVDEINKDTLSCFKINSNLEDLSKIHSDMKVEDIKKILGSEGYLIESSSYSDDVTYLWKISDTVGLEVSYNGNKVRLVGEEIKELE
ncbi:MAG: hypothetical protein VB018_13630 [Lachnospiraceae bacterium]|nr:hypothetical protein [Lachnospiraceae bacterium]